MNRADVLNKMKEAKANASRGAGHIKVTYTYPLKLTKANPGNHNQADCYRETTDSLMVGVHTNNMKYAKDNFAATGQKVTNCPNGFEYPTDPEEQGYFWIHKKDGAPYVRAKFENIAPEYKQRSRYFIDGNEVNYQDLVNAYNNGEFEKSALAVATDRDLFDRHVAVDRVKDIQVIVKEDYEMNEEKLNESLKPFDFNQFCIDNCKGCDKMEVVQDLMNNLFPGYTALDMIDFLAGGKSPYWLDEIINYIINKFQDARQLPNGCQTLDELVQDALGINGEEPEELDIDDEYDGLEQ